MPTESPPLMHLEDRGLVFDATHQPPESRVNAFTSVFRLKSGIFIVGHQSGTAKHAPDATLRLDRSRDAGQTWEPIPFQFPTILEGTPGSLSSGDIAELPDGRLLLTGTWFDRSDPARPLFDPETQGLLHSRQIVAISEDGGNTWGPWKIIPTPGLTGCASTGPLLHWSDGTLALPFESYKEYDQPGESHHAAWLAVSHDGGDTFPDLHLVARHPENAIYYWDQRLCTGKHPGEYVACFWTHDLARKTDLNMHLRHGSLSDNSEPFSQIRETSIRGQIGAPLYLRDGRLLVFVVDRHHPGTMTLWSSRDDGASWPESENLIIHVHDERAALSQQSSNVDFNEYWDDMLKWSFGHPSLVDLGNGRVLCIFYAGTPGCLSIHWARVNTAPH